MSSTVIAADLEAAAGFLVEDLYGSADSQRCRAFTWSSRNNNKKRRGSG